MANPTAPGDSSRDSQNGDSELERSFSAAVRAAENAPGSGAAWDHLEELADKLQRPDDVAAAYRRVLDRGLPKDLFRELCERAVQFHEEWFGDTPEKITEVIGRIIEIDPAADWAFERLTVMLTAASQWDELLALYDRALATTSDDDKRRRLLEDAAQVAKDFADDAGRAAGYLQQLVTLEPDNKALVTSLERILERQERFGDLIELWGSRLDQAGAEEARETQLRIATTLLDKLNDPARALAVLAEVLADSPGDEAACVHAERILDDEHAAGETRRAALTLLRKNLLVAERQADVIRVIERALGFVEPDEQATLHREAATRLAILGRDQDAIGHYRQLLQRDPGDADARKQLRQLAQRTGRHDLHAEALIAAAEASEEPAQRVGVLLEAADIRRRRLDDPDGAVGMYRQVLDCVASDWPDAEQGVALKAAHALSELYEAAERDEERLAVLERLAELEESTAVRRTVLGRAARLAEQLGYTDRALACWRPVLDGDPHDLEALASVVSLLERSERYPELVSALKCRSEARVVPQQRRADKVRIAQLLADKLDRVGDAIDTWMEVRAEFGEDDETLSTLDDLMTRAAKWQDLAHLLSGAAGRTRKITGERLARVGELYRTRLDDAASAIEWYQRALGVDPQGEGARVGLAGLLDGAHARAAAEALAEAYRRTDDWQQILELLEPRLLLVPDRRERGALLREAARLYEQRRADASAALDCLARALPLEPDNLALEAELTRLAEQAGGWERTAAAFEQAAGEMTGAPRRAAELFKAAGGIREHQLEDCDGALAAYRGAVTLVDTDADAHRAIARCAARAGHWDAATGAAIAAMGARDQLQPDIVTALEQAADQSNQWPALATAMAAALARQTLRAELAVALELTVACWQRDRCQDLAAAEQAAGRAVALDRRNADAIGLHAELLRGSPGGVSKSPGALIATLGLLDALEDRSVDALCEAARLAVASNDGSVQARTILERLYQKAGGMWIRGEAASGATSAAEAAEWALEQLVALHTAAGDVERAVHWMLDGVRLPLAPDRAVELRRRAAETLAEGSRGRAIDVYRGVLDARPDDVTALRRVADLCEAEGRVSEALALRLGELRLTADVERRVQLRIDHSRLTGVLEAQGGRVASLKANLEDAPGHEATVEELYAVLDERGRQSELSEILGDQASKLEELGETGAAARLWAKVAALAEGPLQSGGLAIAAHSQVVKLAPTTEALDALARLHLDRDQPADAARWLEQRLESTSESDRVAVLLKLSRARIAAEQKDEAVAALETAFAEAPRNAEVRKLLLGLYRSAKRWDALAEALTRAALAVGDEQTVLRYAREATELYYQKLGKPEGAVPVLRKAVELAPDDKDLRGQLAEGLRLAGELDEAKELLFALVNDFGRRRSPERAAVHLQLAHVAHAQGQTDEALDQLDTASRMDSGNVTVLKTLAELAREAGQLDRAERAYRTLLVSVRREDSQDLSIGPTEVLFELSHIAAERGQDDKAAELVESALESMAQNDGEAEPVQQKLMQREAYDLLQRVLDTRLRNVTVPHLRARIFATRGRLFDSTLERPAAALDAYLEAVKAEPGSPGHHQTAWDAAAKQSKLDAYVAVVETLLSDERADQSAHVRCELYLRLGEVLEKERGDRERAWDLYKKAEATSVRQVDVWRAQARVAGELGHAAEQMRLLERLASLGEDQAETRADALYRLAEVLLASPDTLEDGVRALAKALDDDPRPDRAGLILRAACETHADSGELLDLYESVARKSDDRSLLLHYLEQRVTRAGGTPEQAKEAVELCVELDAGDKAEALMLRAVHLGKESGGADGLARVDWALLGLAQRRKEAGDLAGAVQWLGQAAEVADPALVFEAGRSVAELAAAPDGDLTLAAKLYESLLEQNPTAREAWEPLAGIYAKLGDLKRLELMVDETLDGLQDPAERNALRLVLAEALLGDETRAAAAVDVLQAVLFEDPEHPRAGDMLMAYFERSGRQQDVVDLLHRQLDAAEGREEPEAVKQAAIRLCRRVEGDDAEQAVEVLRRALSWAPEDAELIAAILERLPPDADQHERAELTERLVRVEPPELAGPRALALAALYDEMGDAAAGLGALRLGAERAPDNVEIRERLVQRYRDDGDYQGLCQVLIETAERAEDDAGRAGLWREAAGVHRDQLEDAVTAAELLRQCVRLCPDDVELRVELGATLRLAGEQDAAIATLSEALEDGGDGRLLLLHTRAHLHFEMGGTDAAIFDMEQAFELDPEPIAPQLEEMLLVRREEAAEAGDVAAERHHTLRAVQLMLVQGKRDDASELLRDWVHRVPDDVEALRRLCDVDTASGRWPEVAATCQRLVEIESGTAQIDAALSLSHAYHAIGQPELAQAGLELTLQSQPDNPQVRAQLRKIYEAQGDRHHLAGFLIGDAHGVEDPDERVALLLRAGQIFVDLGDAASAVPPLRAALAARPGDADVTIALCDAYILAGWFDDAGDVLDEAITAGRGRRTPELGTFHQRKAAVAAAQGDRGAQLEHLQEAHLCAKKNGEVAADLANLAEELEDWDLAAKTLRTITLIDTECPISKAEAFYRQGRIALHLGDDKSAKMWARRARREDPESTDIESFLRELGEHISIPPGRR